jgi:hypothetical protein
MTGPTFFLDRGLGSQIVPAGLRASGWSVTTMDERYGADASQHVTDVQWITEAAHDGLVSISKDRNIARVGIEVDAVTASDARLLLLPNSRFTARQLLDRLLRHQAAILRLVEREPGPWIAVVQESGLQRLGLDG